MPAATPAIPVTDGIEIVGGATPDVAFVIDITVVDGAPASDAADKSADVTFALPSARAAAAVATAPAAVEQLVAALATLGFVVARCAAAATAASEPAAKRELSTRSSTTTVCTAKHDIERWTLPEALTLATTTMEVGGTLGMIADTTDPPADKTREIEAYPSLVKRVRSYAEARAFATASVATPDDNGSVIPPLQAADTF